MAIIAVRRESVRIDVDSNLAQVAARDAAAVKLLATNLDSLSRSGVQTDRSTQKISGGLDKAGASARKASGDFDRADSSINQLTGRLRLFADVAAILGPALAPVGALAVPAVTGLANQLGFAAAAGGTALLAFQGVGDAIGAMNEYAVEPTTENLAKVEQELSKLSPAAQTFAREVGAMRDTFIATRDAAAEGLFPGLTRGLDDLDGLLGRVQPILREIGDATGDMLADGLDSLNSDRWQPFFDFLEAEARPVLSELGATTGDFAHGLAEMWMAFQPLNRDFSGWLADVASGFDGWASGLAQTEGFNEFIGYIRDNGPQVADALGALGGALLDIAVAAAPLGGPVLSGLEAFAKIVSAIAESPIGTPLLAAASAMALLNRTMAVTSRVQAGGFFATTAANVSTLSGALGTAEKRAAGFRTAMSGAGRLAGPIAGLALASSDLGEKAGGTAVSMGLMGAAFGPWGALAGVAAGGVMELSRANDDLEASVQRASDAMRTGSLEDMEREHKALQEEIALTDVQTQGFLAGLGQYGPAASLFADMFTGADEASDTLGQLGRDIEQTRSPMLGLSGLFGQTFFSGSEAMREAQMSAADLNAALLAINDALTGRSSMRDYEAALDGLTQSIADNGKTLDINTEAGRANEAALDNIAATSLAVAENLTGMERRRFLVRARQDFIGAAQDLGLGERAARRLANELGLLGRKEAKPKVDLDGAPSVDAGLRRLQRGFNGLPKQVRSKIQADGVPTTAAQINALQRRYNLTPKQVRTLMELSSRAAVTGIGNVQQLLRETGNMKPRPTVTANDNASGIIGNIINLIGNVNDKSVTITTYYKSVRTGVGIGAAAGLNSAEGNFYPGVRHYANGGMDRPDGHLPEFAGPGPTRVWREPETGGESYIPHANDHRRERAKAITAQTAALFGGEVQWYAQGGMRRAMERQGMEAAMRSGGSSRTQTVVVQQGGVLRGTLDTPWGPADVEVIAERAADRRIQDWNDSADDFANDLSGRSADL